MLRKYLVSLLIACCVFGVLVSSVFLISQPVHAQENQTASPCPVKVITKQTGTLISYTCLDRRGQVLSKGHLSPQSSVYGYCNLGIYGNGPFPPTSGWFLCVTGSGKFNIPQAYNDQASSWASCAAGTFYVDSNQRGGSGSFGDLKDGNFPLGNVPNDSMSSWTLNWTDSCRFDYDQYGMPVPYWIA